MFEVNEYVNSRKGLKQGCHKDLKTKSPDFSLSFTKILIIFSLNDFINLSLTILIRNGMQFQANLVKLGLKIILLIYLYISEVTDWQFLKIQVACNLKKDFQKKFKNKGLDIIVNRNMKIVDYLDVMLD